MFNTSSFCGIFTPSQLSTLDVLIGAMAHVANAKREDNSGDDSIEEGYRMLLGGLSITGGAWEEEEEIAPKRETRKHQIADGSGIASQQSHGMPNDWTSTVNSPSQTGIQQHLSPHEKHVPSALFSDAFQLQRDGRIAHPPVLVVDMSSINNHGNGLVATRLIRAGEVVFTERATAGTQIPNWCRLCKEDGRLVESVWRTSLFPTRACQACFRSLEPASSCHLRRDGPHLPIAELWPVPEYILNDGDEVEDGGYRRDPHGRLQCTRCDALFCCECCRVAHCETFGSCCNVTVAIQAAYHSFHTKSMNCDTDAPATLLATRLFCVLLQAFRIDGYRGIGVVEGMCGEPEDITPLEMGIETVRGDDHRASYTLQQTYEAICDSLAVTRAEKGVIPLTKFHQLVAVTARNGFGVTTQSPFRAYHASLSRASGGRGTAKHAELMKQIALTLNSNDGSLHRDMDRQVADRCATRVAAIFRLTARINHSCDPCAEVQGQMFVDSCIDVVARREIGPGEEITISYIPVGLSAGRRATDRSKRVRELKAKYLFLCDCPKCSNDRME